MELINELKQCQKSRYSVRPILLRYGYRNVGIAENKIADMTNIEV